MSAKTLQTDYDKTKAEIKVLETKLKDIEKQAKKEGLFFKAGKLIGNEKILAAFWDGAYYSHFDGHTSDAIYNEFEGSEKLSKTNIDAFNQLLILLKDMTELDEDNKELGVYIDQLIELRNIPYYIANELNELSSNFKIKLKKDYIEFEYKGSEDQGELCDGASIVFKYVNVSELIKCKEKETRG